MIEFYRLATRLLHLTTSSLGGDVKERGLKILLCQQLDTMSGGCTGQRSGGEEMRGMLLSVTWRATQSSDTREMD